VTVQYTSGLNILVTSSKRNLVLEPDEKGIVRDAHFLGMSQFYYLSTINV
jgi:hypothetical protein